MKTVKIGGFDVSNAHPYMLIAGPCQMESLDHARMLAEKIAAAAEAEADLLFLDPPWGGYDHLRTDIADVPLLATALEHGPRYRHVWCKLPPSFDPSELPDYAPEAVFGRGPGDRHRVKFVLLVRR